MTTEGNILFTRMYWAAEITPDKKVVWRYNAPDNTEIHTIQPIGKDMAVMILNREYDPRLITISRIDGHVISDVSVPYFW